MGKQITPEQRDDIVRLTAEGLSRPSISRRLGVSESTVSRTLKELVEDTESRNTLHAIVRLVLADELPKERA